MAMNRSIMLTNKIIIKDKVMPQEIGSPSVYHAVIVLFCGAFFFFFLVWGPLMEPTLVVLHEILPKHTFLMNSLIQGVKDSLSFLSAYLLVLFLIIWG